MKNYKRIMMIFSALLMAGCEDAQINDIKKYIDKVSSTRKTKIEPLPPMITEKKIIYDMHEKRDPFEVPEFMIKKNISIYENDINREKEPLEFYSIESLKMVGVISSNSEQYALISDISGLIYRVKMGNYIGKNFGKIMNIEKNKITVREIYSDEFGQWRERYFDMTISN